MKKNRLAILSLSFLLGLSIIIFVSYQFRSFLFNPAIIQSGDESHFNAYLKFKRIAPKNEDDRQQIYKKYRERQSLAEVIESQKLVNKALIDAELEEFYKEMLISRYFEKFLKEKVTNQAIKNYYSANIKSFQDKKARVAHILLRTDKKMNQSERQVKLTTAQAAYAKAATGVEFSTVVKEYSEDSISAKKAGDIGWIKEGAIAPSFSDKVFTLKIGEISKPIETPFGFHIIKLLEGPLVVTRSYNTVKGNIRYQLRNKTKQAELKRLTAEVNE